ncbi:MAG: GTP cyclohydrolase I FolE2 [Alphaproteobacteria bacterium]|nr:GTP cyclohydrolase I FolE2 [Alphaproteobacteria bacterium]
MTRNPSQAVLPLDLPDHASERDERGLPIDRVGIRGLAWPITVLDQERKQQSTVAVIDASVGLPAEDKGTHMSRFVEILNEVSGELTVRNMPHILETIRRRLEAPSAYLTVRFPYFVMKEAPVSRARSWMEYDCTFDGLLDEQGLDFTLGIQIPVKSLCPCSKAISEYGAHNQRSLVDVAVRSSEFLWIEDLIRVVEDCASAPLYALLKREDEKFVTEQAYDNPRFVEDLVREVVIALRSLPGVRWVKVTADNQESIHKHSAWAELSWSREDENARRQTHLEMPAPETPEALPFGSWLRRERRGRQFSQQAFAERVGVSASFLSRVESGEKGLSGDSLCRVAAVFGMEAEVVQLRAGVVPEKLLTLMSQNPEGFLRLADRIGNTSISPNKGR